MLGKPLVTFRISLSREYLFAPMVQGSQKRAEHKTNVTWEKKNKLIPFHRQTVEPFQTVIFALTCLQCHLQTRKVQRHVLDS